MSTDRKIHAGGEIDREIQAAMAQAELFLLMISSSFLNSNYCFEKEFTHALKKQRAGKVITLKTEMLQEGSFIDERDARTEILSFIDRRLLQHRPQTFLPRIPLSGSI